MLSRMPVVALLTLAFGALLPTSCLAADRFMVFTAKPSLAPVISPPSEMLANEILHWTGLQWVGWGQPTATATGLAVFDETGYSTQVNLALDGLRDCAGYRLYTRVTASYPADATLQQGGGDTSGGTRPCKVAMLTNDDDLTTYVDRAHPRRFDLGDVGFRSFTWTGWNRRTATGRGRAVAFNTPRGGVAARLRLSDAGPCGAHTVALVYRRIETRIRVHGRWQHQRKSLCT